MCIRLIQHEPEARLFDVIAHAVVTMSVAAPLYHRYLAFARGFRRSGRRAIASWGRRCCSMWARRTFNRAPPTEPAKYDPDHSRLARQ